MLSEYRHISFLYSKENLNKEIMYLYEVTKLLCPRNKKMLIKYLCVI